MDADAFLADLKNRPDYAGQIVYVREVAPRPATLANPAQPLPEPCRRVLQAANIDSLYTHQAAAIDHLRAGENIVVVSATAGGKTLQIRKTSYRRLPQKCGKARIAVVSQHKHRTYVAGLA